MPLYTPTWNIVIWPRAALAKYNPSETNAKRMNILNSLEAWKINSSQILVQSKFTGTQWILHFMETFKEVLINTRLDVVGIFLKNLQKRNTG